MAKQPLTSAGKRRRNFYLPEDLMDWVEQHAGKRDVSMTQVLIKALEAYKRAVEAREPA